MKCVSWADVVVGIVSHMPARFVCKQKHMVH